MKNYALILLCLFFTLPLHAQSRDRKSIDSLASVIKSTANDTVRIKALRNLGFLYTRTSPEKAKTCFRQAIQLGMRIHENVYTASTYTQLCILYADEGKTDSAQYFLQQAKRLVEKEKNNQRLWADYYQSEGLYYKHQGDYKGALSSYFQELKFLKASGHITGEAGCYINIGNIYRNEGSLRKAIEYELKALKLFEKLNNKRGKTYCYQNIGEIFRTLKQYKDALKYLQLASTQKAELGDKKGMASSLKAMSLAAAGMGKYAKAAKYAQLSLHMYKELKLAPEVADAYLLRSKIYRAAGNSTLAKKYILLADSTARGINDEALSARITAEKMSLDTAVFPRLQPDLQQKNVEAVLTLDNLHQSLNNAYQSGDSNRIANNYLSLSGYYVRRQDFKNAYQYLQSYHALQNRMTDSDVQLQIKELETRYRVEKKDNEIKLLNARNELQTARNHRIKLIQYFLLFALLGFVLIGWLLLNRYRIRQQLREQFVRNQISRDLHDDIGSTITNIHILSKIALEQDKEQVSIHKNIKQIKNYASTIMENMSDIVWAINPQNDTIERMVVRMKEFAAEMLEPANIDYTFSMNDDFSEIKLDMAQRRDFFLIFKEALHNAVKHSSCRNVFISLPHKDKNIVLKMEDDGKGFDNRQKGCGNGLANMQQRAAAMQGTLEIASSTEKGTIITLQIPIT